MDQYILTISNIKNEIITYSGYSIDNYFLFTFTNGSIFYIEKNKFDLYKSTGKIKRLN